MIGYLILGVALLGLDQWVKAYVIANLAIGQSRVMVPGVLSLTHIKNTGAAFSMLEGQQWLFYVIALIALGVVVYLWKDSKRHWLYRLSLVLIASGAVGNLIDRLRFKEVTDMFQLDFMNFAIFNVADVCLNVGVVFAMIYLIFLDHKTGERA